MMHSNTFVYYMDYSFQLVARGLLYAPSQSQSVQVRASYCSTRLSRAQVPAFAGSSVQDKKKRGVWSKGVLPALAVTREYEQSDQNWLQVEGGLRC